MSLEQSTPQAFPLPAPGDVLAGKYRIERVLGRGGNGVVFAAEHVVLRQRVAVKFLLPEGAATAEMRERFLREARAAVVIHGEHVAQVFDIDTHASGAPYLVMELLSGVDLGALLKKRGALPVAEAVDYVLQACEAIAEAHAIGIIHRDLKPANLFLASRADGSPLVKVLDFGLSKLSQGELDKSLTAANVVMGTPYYMSPQQVRDLKGVDARTDVWAIGVILYELLAAARPFEGDAMSTLFKIIGPDEPAPLAARRPDLPPALVAAVMRCLVKDPDARTRSVAELARAIAPFGSPESQVSVERIHRVLRDSTPFVRLASHADLSGNVPALAAGAAATVLSSAPAAPADEAHRTSASVKSASMAALSASLERRRSRPPRADEPSPAAWRAATIGVVAILALGVVGIAFGLRRGAPMAGADLSSSAQATVSATSLAQAMVSASASAQTMVAAPSASVSGAAPSAMEPQGPSDSASPPAPAAPIASSSAPGAVASAAPKAKGQGRIPALKKSADPFDRWR